MRQLRGRRPLGRGCSPSLAAPCKTPVRLRRRLLLLFMPRFAFSLLLLLLLAPASFAQNRSPVGGAFKYSAPKITGRAGSIRLEGTPEKPARISSPQLSVVAPIIAFDLANNTVSQVRASGGVTLKVNRSQTTNGPKTYVESRSQSAVLTAGTTRTLELEGDLSGFYQIGSGPKSTLSGKQASLRFAGNDFSASVDTPDILIPAEAKKGVDALAELRVTANQGEITGGGAKATFTGNARAVASGPNPFDLSAPKFIVSRASDGTLSTLETQGKTLVKYDLPPDPKQSETPSALGKPTHVEVSADGAVFDRSTSQATFSGNVRGFYRLQSASGTRDFPFSGGRAVISFDPNAASTKAGLNVLVTGDPVAIDAPAFEF